MSQPNTDLTDLAMHALVDNARDALLILDTCGRIQFLNRKAETITGRTKEELIGRPFSGIIREEKTINPEMTEPEQVMVTFKTPQGDIPAEILFKPAFKDGVYTGILLMTAADHKRSAALKSLEKVGSALQRLSSQQQIFDVLREGLKSRGYTFGVLSLHQGYFLLEYYSDSGRVHRAESTTGIALSDIHIYVKKYFMNMIREGKYFFFSDILSFMSTDQSITSEVRSFFALAEFSRGVAVPLTSADVLTGVLLIFSEHIQHEDAPTLYALGVQVSAALERADSIRQLDHDLRALQRQIDSRTQELEKMKSQMESLVQSSVDAIIATDLHGCITFVNRGVETMFGYKREEMVGKSLAEYYAGGEKEAEKHKKALKKGEKLENVEFDFLAKDNRMIHALASFSLLQDKKKNVTGIMGVLKDITEQKRLQKTLESLNKAAFRIQKSKTREEIFTITSEELKQFHFYVAFMLFNEEKTFGKLAFVTAEEEFSSIQNLKEMLMMYEFPLGWEIRDLLEKKEALYIGNIRSITRTVLPDIYKEYRNRLDNLEIINRRAIVAPLVSLGEVSGILAVLSDTITAGDIPSIHAFANQVSTALENALLLEESQNRADELKQNVEEQQLLRELNTKLFEAQSADDILDATIEGIFRIFHSFCTIHLLNGERTHAVVRMESEQVLLKIVEKIGRKMKIAGIVGCHVPVEEGTIFCEFFRKGIPLISSNVKVGTSPVLRAELPDLRRGIAPGIYGVEVLTRVQPYRSVMMFPITTGGTTTGCITVTSKAVFTKNDFNVGGMIAEMVSSALERICQSEKVGETFAELRALQKINTLLNMGASLDSILRQVSSNIREVYHYEFVYPLLLDPSRRYLTFEHVVLPLRMQKKVAKVLGADLTIFKHPISEDSPLYKTVMHEKKCLIWKGFKEMADQIPAKQLRSSLKTLSPLLSRGFGIKPGEGSIMVAPLRWGEEIIGVLFLGHKKLLNVEDYHHLEYFLDQVGIAIAKSEGEKRVRQSLDELRELDQMKSEFIDIASHELRTPLTTLKLYLEMIAREKYGKLSPQLGERIRVMQEGVNRLEEIINQTLVASRLIKDKLELEEKEVSVQDAVVAIVNQFHPLWKKKRQNILVDVTPDLPLIRGDEKALSAAVANLVDNAIRYSPENSEIYITFLEHPAEVECVITDQGCGIPPEYAEKIFEEFYIVPSKTEYARQDGRTGLGLFIARGIIERHSGRIWMESVPGKGSTFHFVLPKKLKKGLTVK